MGVDVLLKNPVLMGKGQSDVCPRAKVGRGKQLGN
jgi:hypothetical protein